MTFSRLQQDLRSRTNYYLSKHEILVKSFKYTFLYNLYNKHMINCYKGI